MNITTEEFLQMYINLIDENNFEELYILGLNAFDRHRNIGQVTEYLLKADINPLEYLSSIPDFYLAGTHIENFIIPKEITSIGEFAFFMCNKLKSINIPQSVDTIGEFAFAECTSLNSITFPNNIKTLKEHICKDCEALSQVELPEKLQYIDHAAFINCKHLITVKLPKSLKYISRAAFLSCPLTDIYYEGSKEEWNQIDKDRATFRCKIHCLDGIFI